MDLIDAIIIRPHSGLYDYALAHSNGHGPLSVFMWPSVVLGVIVTYLLLVKVALPIHMIGRQPYNLRSIILTYNGLQCVANVLMFVLMIAELRRQEGDFLFTGCVQSTPQLVFLSQVWFLNKYSDLIETGFFVLRRKFNQVSFLHVYHHVVVIYYAFMSYVEGPGGHQVLTGVMNCSVHAMMYFYYFMSIYDRQWVEGFMDYKRRITQLQIIQFFVNALWYGKSWIGLCEFPLYLSASGCIQNGVLIYLFGNFYYHAYIKQKKKADTVVMKSVKKSE